MEVGAQNGSGSADGGGGSVANVDLSQLQGAFAELIKQIGDANSAFQTLVNSVKQAAGTNLANPAVVPETTTSTATLVSEAINREQEKLEVQERVNSATDEHIEQVEKIAEKNAETADVVQESWTGFGDDLADLFSDVFKQITKDGELSFEKMFASVAPKIGSAIEDIVGIDFTKAISAIASGGDIDLGSIGSSIASSIFSDALGNSGAGDVASAVIGLISEGSSGSSSGDFGNIISTIGSAGGRMIGGSAAGPIGSIFGSLGNFISTGPEGGMSNVISTGMSIASSLMGGGGAAISSGLASLAPSLGLTTGTAIPGAFGGSMATSAAVAPTAAGSLAAGAGIAIGGPLLVAALAAMSIMQKMENHPRSAATIEAADGLFGTGYVEVENGGDKKFGESMADAANTIANGILEATSTRLSADAGFLGSIGLVDKRFASRIEGGIFGGGESSLGIDGLSGDRNLFGMTENGQRAAIVDFATRSVLNQAIKGNIEGLTDAAKNTLQIGLANIARNLEYNGLNEEEFAEAVKDIEFVARFDELKDALLGVGDAADDAAQRLTMAERSQQKFNFELDRVRSEAAEAAAEEGVNPLADVGNFVDRAIRLFDPSGGERFQIRRALSVGDYRGEGTYRDAREYENNVTLARRDNSNVNDHIRMMSGSDLSDSQAGWNLLGSAFSYVNDTSTGRGEDTAENNVDRRRINVLGEDVQLLRDPDSGAGDGFTDPFFGGFGSGIGFNIDSLATELQRLGFSVDEADQYISDFFTPDDRDRVAESLQIAKAQVEEYFDSLDGSLGDQIDGPISLFEEIVPSLSPIVEQMITLQEQVKATRPELVALNEDLAEWGEELVDVDGLITQGLADVAESAQDQFLATLGIGVGEDGDLTNSIVDFQQINDLATMIKGADLNANELFKEDPRNLLPEVRTRIDEMLEKGIAQILASADDAEETLEQIQEIFGDRINGMEFDVEEALEESTEMKSARAIIREERVKMLQSQIKDLQEEKSETEKLWSLAKGNAERLRDAITNLKLDDTLSPLSMEERLNLARSEFDDALSIANSGDPADKETQEAISSLPGLSNKFLKLSQDYYASSEDYLADFNRVQEALESTASRQESIEEQQLGKLDDINTQLEKLDAILEQLGGTGLRYVQGGDGQYVTTGTGGLPAGIDLGHNPEQNIAIYRFLQSIGKSISGFGEGQLASVRSNPTIAAAIDEIDANFATGGIMTSSGPLELNRYALGGVADRPQIALFGEGRMPEAYVPLPDGRSIPVTIANDAGPQFGQHADERSIQGIEMMVEETRKVRAEIAAVREENAGIRRGLARVVAGSQSAGRAA